MGIIMRVLRRPPKAKKLVDDWKWHISEMKKQVSK
jgi:hypothetical protein